MNPLHPEYIMLSFSSSSFGHATGILSDIPIYAPSASSEASLIDWENKPTFMCFIWIATFAEFRSCHFGRSLITVVCLT